MRAGIPCPRCGGSCFEEVDVGAVYLVCLQCGREEIIAGRFAADPTASAKARRRKRVGKP